ncbi:MAG: hypothetical protein H6977_15985 [Gammaproteobacteria bacterium]|nr:hypothetical protein [Gammaproteobacteria bacterium]
MSGTQALIEQVRDAFTSVEYPGDDALTDSFGEEAEALVREFSRQRDWRVLDPAFLDQAPEGWGTALSFFSAAALRFYLPAYLVADLAGALNGSNPAVRLCAFLAGGYAHKKLARIYGGGTLGEHARREFAAFTPAQVSAIVAYLWWKLDQAGYDPTIEQALENYWLEREAACADGGPHAD